MWHFGTLFGHALGGAGLCLDLMIFEGFPNISDSLALWCCDLAHTVLEQTVSAVLQCDEITGANGTRSVLII